MKLTDIEWDVLRGALRGFGIVLAVGALCVGTTHYYVDQLAHDNSQFQNSLDQIRNRYVAAVQERALVETYWPRYTKLEQDGFIGNENRLDWVDLLHTLAARHRVLDLNYEVQPRALVTPENNLNLGDFTLQGSKISLHLSLLHEGNLLALLRDLSEHTSGLFNLESCEIKRSQEKVVISNAPNISADCTLVWHTLQASATPS